MLSGLILEIYVDNALCASATALLDEATPESAIQNNTNVVGLWDSYGGSIIFRN